MRYISTRRKAAPLFFEGALLAGLASDGGLYIAEEYPNIGRLLPALKGASYLKTAFEIVKLFAPQLDKGVLWSALAKVYNKTVFRDADDVVSIKHIGNGMSLLDLNAGPSLAFKDLALQVFGELIVGVLQKRETTMNIVGATTGDTGSAAEYAMRGKKGVVIFMLSPERGMSPFQRAQMYSLKDKNVINIAVKGSFDTCQDMVKKTNEDEDFKKKYRIGAVNSINLARVLLQVVYYVYAYLRVARRIGDSVSFTVPSGNFGNICAAHTARMMGLPIGRLILATNENDVLCDFFNKGIYRPRPEVVLTSSPSMNISKASNLERFIFDLFERRPYGRAGKTREFFEQLKTEGSFSISKEDLARTRDEFGFVAGRSTEADRLRVIREVYDRTGLMIDPHTADGICVAQRLRLPGEQIVALSTASPLKFGGTMKQALGFPIKIPKRFGPMMNAKPRFITIKPDVAALRRIIEDYAI